ncbi:hypothetical protein RI367_002131 [Sorochytrium milnesiophthora]
MPQIHNVCSHLQNAFRARLQATSVPHSSLNQRLLSLLQRKGFLSAVAYGSERGAYDQPRGVSDARIWVDLKYTSAAQPVLSSLQTVSKPSRRVFASVEDLREVAAGKKCRRLLYVGLRSPLEPGQMVAIRTGDGSVLDLYEAVEKGVGGEVLCSAK